MRVTFAKAFHKDIKQVPKDIQLSFGEIVQFIESASSIAEVQNCKKLQGSENAYRIRIRTYRATFLLIHVEDTVFFQRILTRGQIYKKHI